jgi:hypothetical protein
MTIAELFSDPTKLRWGALAHDATGNPCKPRDPQAVCWCLQGATQYLYPLNHEEIYARLRNSVCGGTVRTAHEVVHLAKRAQV